jgi:transcriptional regulator with PAS, ATPase and Fis domain
MRALIEHPADRASQSVLIVGETGTGKRKFSGGGLHRLSLGDPRFRPSAAALSRELPGRTI